MQIINSNGSVIEKIIRDKNGNLVRAKFFVYENAGRIKARLIEAIIIHTLKGATQALSGFAKERINYVVNYSREVFKSSYFNKENLYFSGSKPRAPTK